MAKLFSKAFNKQQDAVYVEPFVGGGAILFWVLKTYPHIRAAYINDINSHLMTTYRVVRDNPEQLLCRLETLQEEYSCLGDEDRTAYYLHKRDSFNKETPDDADRAALLIFLNRTCFNGLYRVNSQGKFNVPHGRYKHPKICDERTIREDARLLQKVTITHGDFADTLQYASPRSFYYLDPPYKPLSATSSFNTYSKEAFDDREQVRLRDFCNELEARGSRFVLSNSDLKNVDPGNEFFDSLYSTFSIARVYATRMINAKPDKRGKLTELIIDNI